MDVNGSRSSRSSSPAGLFLFVFELVRRKRLMERYALLWLFAVGGPARPRDLARGPARAIASPIGIYYAPSALFAIAFGFVLVLLLHFSLVISRLADQNKVLAQRLGLPAAADRRAGARDATEDRESRPRARRRADVSAGPALAAIVVAHDSAADLPRRWRRCAPQLRAERRAGRRRQRAPPTQRRGGPRAPARRARAGRNLGFAGGAAAGARARSAPLLLFLNPDAWSPRAPRRAARGRGRRTRAGARGRRSSRCPAARAVNTSGGVTHWLGFGWAGGSTSAVADVAARPARGRASPPAPRSSSAAGVGARPAASTRAYFMYGEDLDLSLRLRLAGWGVGVVPGRARRARLRVRQGRLQVVPPGAQPLVDAARRLPARRCCRCCCPALLAFELALLPVAAARRLAAAPSCARRPPCCARCRGRCAGAARVQATRRASTRGASPRRLTGVARLAVPGARPRGSRRAPRAQSRVLAARPAAAAG